MNFVSCVARGGDKRRILEKKYKVQVCCKRNLFCPKPLASHRTSVIWLYLSKLVRFCLSLILCRNICYRAVLCVKYLTGKKLLGPVCVQNLSFLKTAAVSNRMFM